MPYLMDYSDVLPYIDPELPRHTRVKVARVLVGRYFGRAYSGESITILARAITPFVIKRPKGESIVTTLRALAASY